MCESECEVAVAPFTRFSSLLICSLDSGRTGTGLLPPFARHDSDLCPICRGVSHLKIQRMLRKAHRYADRHIIMPPGMNRHIDMSTRHEPAHRCAARQINKHSTVLLGPAAFDRHCADVTVERLLIILFLNGRCCCWRFHCFVLPNSGDVHMDGDELTAEITCNNQLKVFQMPSQ